MRRATPLLVAAALLATAACGTTVQNAGAGAGGLQQGPAGGTTGGDGLTVPGGTTGGTSGGTTGLAGTTGTAPLGGSTTGGTTTGGTTTGGTTTGGTATGGTTGGGTTGGTTGAPGGAVSGPGITASEVRIGVSYCTDCAGANAALGAGGDDPGDTRRYARAAIDDVNARGGVLGRKLVPVFHGFSASDNIDASAQAACERWTKDTPVAGMFFRGEVIYDCARKAGVLAGNTVMDAVTGPILQRYPNLFSPNAIRLEGLYGLTVNAMVKAGWHKPGGAWPTGKIGLITWQSPQYEYAMKEGYLKAMKANGLKDEDVRYIAVPQNAGSIADASAAVSNAVLAFRQKGIDHVFIGDGAAGIFGGVGLTLLFLQNAQSQSYFPRYGFNGNNGPDFPNHPQRQLVGMLAIDGLDEDPAKDQGIAPHAGRNRCFEIMRKKGLPVGDAQTQNIALLACEAAFFAATTFARANGSSLDRVIPAVESLGTSYRSVFTYGTRFGPGKHDGVYLFRNLQYDQSCSCLKYTSKPYEP